MHKEEKIRNNKKENVGLRVVKFWAGAAIVAFLAASAVYIVLLQTEKKMMEGYEKGEVYLALQEIPAGEMLTEENLPKYLTLTSMDSRLIPETALSDPAEAINLIAVGEIEKGVVLTKGMFEKVSEITKGMNEPVVAGFRAEDLYQVAGGILRAGDRIHIYGSEEEIGTFLIWENVYVQQVFDSGGVAIESGDHTTAAQRINIFLDRKDVESFYTRLEQGSLRVVKIW